MSPQSGRQARRSPGQVDRPYARYFRYSAPGILTAKLAADEPATGFGRTLARSRRVLFGRPLSNEEELGERLSSKKALPVFSSDVMSSVAYATEASLFTLLAAGTAYFYWLIPISIAIVGLLALVTISYRQTIRAYPNGGGSYIVAQGQSRRAAGPDRRRRAAGRLRADRGRERLVRNPGRGIRIPRALPAHGAAHRARDPAGHGRQPARPARERHALCLADLHLPGHDVADAGPRHCPVADRQRPARDGRDARASATRDVQRAATPARLCRRLLGHDRHGGRGQRRARLQAARVEERSGDDADHERSARDDVPGHLVPGGCNGGGAGCQR